MITNINTLIILVAFALCIYTFYRAGIYAPSTVFSLFAFMCIMVFYIIFIFNIQRTDVIFCAMPIPNFDNSTVQTTLLYFLFLVALGPISIVNISKRKPHKLTNKIQQEAFDYLCRPIMLLIITFIALLGVLHFIELDKALLWYNTRYLTINVPEEMGITTLFGRIYHLLIGPLGFIFFPLSIYYIKRKKILFFLICILISMYGFILFFAADSRWAPLYLMGGLGFNLFISKKKLSFINIFLGFLFLFTYLKVLIGRNLYVHGLSQSFLALRYISFSLVTDYLFGFLINTFQSALGFANSLLLGPFIDDTYKLLSFSPLISAIDGYENIREMYRVQIAPHVPMSAYDEVWHFGSHYMILFFSVIIIWLRQTTNFYFNNRSITSMILLLPTYWVIFSLSQYSIRTTWRYILLLTFISYVLNLRIKYKEQKRIR